MMAVRPLAELSYPTGITRKLTVQSVRSDVQLQSRRVRSFHFSFKAIEDRKDNAVHAGHVDKTDHGPCPSAHLDEAAFNDIGSAQFPPQGTGEAEEREEGKSFSSCFTIVG